MKSKQSKFLLLASFLLVLGACGKTTKGKLENEWKIDSHIETEETYENGELDAKRVTSFIGDTYSVTVNNSSYGGEVLANEMTIKKDGTWSLVRKYKYSFFASPVIFVDLEQSGTWNFVKKSKSDDAKKNEYVYFHILKENVLSGLLGNNSNLQDETSEFYEGENTLQYCVIESKKDALKLELTNSYSGTEAGTVYSEKRNVVVELSKK
jgi:hypothetical protein